MSKPQYILRVEDGELFGYYEPWLKMPGFVVYDPEKHGYRAEVAKQLGLDEPKQSTPAPVKPAEPKAGSKTKSATTATEPKESAQGSAPEPDLSAVFAQK